MFIVTLLYNSVYVLVSKMVLSGEQSKKQYNSLKWIHTRLLRGTKITIYLVLDYPGCIK